MCHLTWSGGSQIKIIDIDDVISQGGICAMIIFAVLYISHFLLDKAKSVKQPHIPVVPIIIASISVFLSHILLILLMIVDYTTERHEENILPRRTIDGINPYQDIISYGVMNLLMIVLWANLYRGLDLIINKNDQSTTVDYDL